MLKNQRNWQSRRRYREGPENKRDCRRKDRTSLLYEYIIKEALKFVKATQSVRLELLEQHTLGDQLKMLGKITSGAKIPTDYGR